MLVEEAPINPSQKSIPHGTLGFFTFVIRNTSASDTSSTSSHVVTCLGILYVDEVPSELLIVSTMKTIVSIEVRASGMS